MGIFDNGGGGPGGGSATNITFLQPLTGAIVRTANAKMADIVSVLDFAGVDPTGVLDSTAGIQAAIDAVQPKHSQLFFPAGTYRVTEPLTVYQGTQLVGENLYGYNAGFAKNPLGSRINFSPAVQGDLFSAAWKGAGDPGFVFYLSIQNFYIFGNSVSGGATTSRYALNLPTVIYSSFGNLAIDGFQSSVRCSKTINNEFFNSILGGTLACVTYAGNTETTDVWRKCTFFGSPVGVAFAGAAIGIRFTTCNFEQLDNFGLDIAMECQTITLDNCYSEDVPFANNAAGAMFRIGVAGAVPLVENQLTVVGGIYQGRNAGTVGSFVSSDNCYSAMYTAVNVSRYATLFSTTPNTRVHAHFLAGLVGIGFTTVGDVSKVSGLIPTGVLNAGGSTQLARLANATLAGGFVADSGQLLSGQLTFPVVEVPSANPNTLDDYSESLNWTPVIFGSGTAGTYELAATTRCTSVKVGSNVTVSCHIVLAVAVTGGGSGDVRISGFPLQFSATYYGAAASAIVNGIAFTGTCIVVERDTGGATDTVYLSGLANTGMQTQIPIANVVANAHIDFEFSYVTD